VRRRLGAGARRSPPRAFWRGHVRGHWHGPLRRFGRWRRLDRPRRVSRPRRFPRLGDRRGRFAVQHNVRDTQTRERLSVTGLDAVLLTARFDNGVHLLLRWLPASSCRAKAYARRRRGRTGATRPSKYTYYARPPLPLGEGWGEGASVARRWQRRQLGQ